MPSRANSLLSSFLLSAAALVFVQSNAATAVEYCNPLPVSIADPHVINVDGKYFLYGTNAVDRGFRVLTSTDMIGWEKGELCYSKMADSWGQRDFWAPEVIKRGESYYLFYTAQHEKSGDRNICVALASSPLGPFRDIQAPLIPGGSYIDGHPYHHAPTNEYFLYYVGEGRTTNSICMAKLNDTFTGFETSPTRCLQASQPWETNWVEGPVIVPHGRHYYMMYSGSAFWNAGYNVGYAVAQNPMGPWKKFDGNPILRNTPEVSGPGHNCVLTDNAVYYVFYHRHRTPSDKKRVLALDRMIFAPDPQGGLDLMTLPDAPSATTQTLQRPREIFARLSGT
ncbi:MAG: glycoside hydrolase family 43 protein [Candidatus Sumerlaeaceae bacterium]